MFKDQGVGSVNSCTFSLVLKWTPWPVVTDFDTFPNCVQKVSHRVAILHGRLHSQMQDVLRKMRNRPLQVTWLQLFHESDRVTYDAVDILHSFFAAEARDQP
jgi:hypothetical protein